MSSYLSELKGTQVDLSVKSSSITTATIATRDALDTNLFSVGKQVLVLSGVTGKRETYEWNGAGWDAVLLDFVDFDTSETIIPQEGRMGWDTDSATFSIGLSGGVTLQLGQEQYIRAKNTDIDAITNGQAVYISGASGNRAEVKKVIASQDLATKTIAICTEESIGANQNGFFTTVGLVKDLDTASIGVNPQEGDPLYLSPDTSGTITNVKPDKPNYCVCIGYIITVNANIGQIFVKIGYNPKLGDLSDVDVTGLVDGSIIRYNGTNSKYEIDNGIYGEIHAHGNELTQSIPSGVIYTKVDKFTDNGNSSNVTPDHINDRIVIDRAGTYKAEVNHSFFTNIGNIIIYASVFVDGVEQENVHFSRKIGTSGDVGNATAGGFITCNENTVIDFRVRHSGGVSVDLTSSYVNLNVVYSGV